MKIYNEAMTIELTNPDLERGYLRPQKRLKEHHDAIPERVIKTVDEVKDELIRAGKEVLYYESIGAWCVTTDYCPETDGREIEEIKPVIEPAVPAFYDFEDVKVYHPYTDDEYRDYLRQERKRICFSVINRGAPWYARLTDDQKTELETWYQAWLDAPETEIKPKTPEWI